MTEARGCSVYSGSCIAAVEVASLPVVYQQLFCNKIDASDNTRIKY
jgi:hypothetical protein